MYGLKPVPHPYAALVCGFGCPFQMRLWLFLRFGCSFQEQQIPFGNDRKKSKSASG
jgi:hypothetical protein